MCDRCGPFFDPGHNMTEGEFEEYQAYWEGRYYAHLQKEHDDAQRQDYQEFLRELQIEAFERGETFIDV